MKSESADPKAIVAYVKYCDGAKKMDDGFGRAASTACDAAKTWDQPPSLAGMTTIAAMTVTYMSVSFTNAISAGARSPLVYVYAASNTNETVSAGSPSCALKPS